MPEEIAGTPPAEHESFEIAKFVYERSQETFHHDDTFMWEVASIIWGANTLLLGFTLEAIHDPLARPLIIATSVIAIALTFFVNHFFSLAKVGQHIAHEMCRAIEAKFFPAELALHTKIHEKYENPCSRVWFCFYAKSRTWVHWITWLFVAVWLFVLCWAVRLQFCCKSGSC